MKGDMKTKRCIVCNHTFLMRAFRRMGLLSESPICILCETKVGKLRYSHQDHNACGCNRIKIKEDKYCPYCQGIEQGFSVKVSRTQYFESLKLEGA